MKYWTPQHCTAGCGTELSARRRDLVSSFTIGWEFILRDGWQRKAMKGTVEEIIVLVFLMDGVLGYDHQLRQSLGWVQIECRSADRKSQKCSIETSHRISPGLLLHLIFLIMIVPSPSHPFHFHFPLQRTPPPHNFPKRVSPSSPSHQIHH